MEKEKSKADIWIEKFDELCRKNGLKPPKLVDGHGCFVYIPSKNSNIIKDNTNKHK